MAKKKIKLGGIPCFLLVEAGRFRPIEAVFKGSYEFFWAG